MKKNAGEENVKDIISYANNEIEKKHRKISKIKMVVVSVIILITVALFKFGFIWFASKPTKDTGLYFNEEGRSVTIALDVEYHKGLNGNYYTGEVVVDGTTYKSVYDIYHTKTSLFVVENDYALTAFENSLTFADFSDGEKTVRIINITRKEKTDVYIGPADDYEEAMRLYNQ